MLLKLYLERYEELSDVLGVNRNFRTLSATVLKDNQQILKTFEIQHHDVCVYIFESVILGRSLYI